MLQHSGKVLNIWEHIGDLRFTGLDGIIVACKEFACLGPLKGSWPPYDGCSDSYWQALQPAIAKTDESVVWRSVPQRSCWRYPDKPWRFTAIRPSDDDQTSLSVTTDYPIIGREYTEVQFSDFSNFLPEIMAVKSQGWPFFAYRPATWLERLPLPVKFRPSQMTWPQQVGIDRARVLYNHHRILDILGGVSIIWHDALPACHVQSYCSGHLGDVMAVKGLTT